MSLRRTASRPLRAGPLAIGLAVIAVALGPAANEAQEPLPLIGVEADLSAYGLSSAGDVGRGRVSVAYAPEGPRLVVHHLRADPVAPRITYPEPPPTPEPVEAERAEARHTALWVWNTAELVADAAARATFLDFVEREGITRIFLYLAAARGERPVSGYIPFSSAEMGPLLADLRGHGALAYALDGDRDYVREENHAGVLRTVRRLVEHNQAVPFEQRFHGVRYDIEPYLAPGFQGPTRQDLLDGYVRLLADASAIAREGGLAFGVDVPFWFDAPDDETGTSLEAELDGRRARVIEHLMEIADDMAIMDYRTTAEGANGALAHAYHELEMGEDAGVDVFVGVETTRLLDEDLFTFFGPPEPGLPERGTARWIVLEEAADGRHRLWLVDGDEAIAALAERTADARSLRRWPAGRPTRVAADLQSFHGLGAGAMRDVTGRIVRHLVAEPAFAGLAFHDYLGLRALLEGPR